MSEEKARFDKALIIAHLDDSDEPMSAEMLWVGGLSGSKKQISQRLRALVKEGVLIRTEHIRPRRYALR